MLKNFTYLIALAAMFYLWGEAEAQTGLEVKVNKIRKDTARILQIIEPKLVFVTSQDFNGKLGGLAGADKKCQRLADSAGLGGVFQAWLSDEDASPTTRFQTLSLGPYFLLNGVMVAANFVDLLDGSLNAAIGITERGGTVTARTSIVYTATGPDGTFVGQPPDASCSGWTDGISGLGPVTGSTRRRAGGRWTTASGSECVSPRRLYCFEQ